MSENKIQTQHSTTTMATMKHSGFLSPKIKLWEHIIESVLVLIAIALTGYYMNLGVRFGRADIMVIPFVSFDT